ncbi:hypothetical protein MVEN_02046400 [Mycena venus]|uniref:Uncharacterized protein n=1 Tax=Mycena venus TaxID=2733690 RepID=A0A8H6XBW1_9AGAR|nr:hypothetical protein MVEN_02046400 [Mycena venus]
MAYDRTRASHIHAKIHTLRGEYFRHIQNQNSLPRNFKPITHNAPTLPADLLTDSAYSKEKPRPPRDTREALFVPKRVEKPQHDLTTNSTWRAEALSLAIPTAAEHYTVPPLTLLCLQTLITTFDADFAEIVPFIPPHLRQALLRWAAVHRPLTNHQLRVLCSNGHAAGELIVVGPNAIVREEYFRDSDAEESQSAEWESDDWLPPPPMHTLVLMSAHLALSAISTLPATLTNLALVNINPVSLHRLPMTCPLVECLDLSYNAWLVGEKEAQERLGKPQWSRWHQLRTLGLRGCYIPADLILEVNKGRWDDVRVVK